MTKKEEQILYLSESLLTIVNRSGMTPEICLPAIMILCATTFASTQLKDEAIIDEFKKNLDMARINIAQIESEKASKN